MLRTNDIDLLGLSLAVMQALPRCGVHAEVHPPDVGEDLPVVYVIVTYHGPTPDRQAQVTWHVDLAEMAAFAGGARAYGFRCVKGIAEQFYARIPALKELQSFLAPEHAKEQPA